MNKKFGSIVTILIGIMWILNVFSHGLNGRNIFMIIPLLLTGYLYNLLGNQRRIVKEIIILTITVGTYFTLEKLGFKNIENVIIMKKIAAIVVAILFLYFSNLLKKGHNFENIFIKTLLYMGYGFLACLASTLIVNLVDYLFSISNFIELFKIYEIILISVFSLVYGFYYVDEKKYTSKAVNIIFVSFVTLGLFLVYVNTLLNLKSQLSLSLHLILWFSYAAFGINTVLKKKYINIFLIPLNILLVYFVGKQIQNYGVTENRYFILAFGFLLLVFNGLNIFFEIKTEIYGNIFVSIMVVTFFIPWINSFDVTNRYLTERYYKLYNQENVTEKEIRELKSIYEYQKDRNRNLPYEYKQVELEVHQNETYETKEFQNENIQIDTKGYKNVEYLYINYNSEFRKGAYSYKIKNKNYDLIDLIYNDKLENKEFKIIVLNGNISRSKTAEYPYPTAYLDVIILIK